MKKVLIVLIVLTVLVLAVSLVACNNEVNNNVSNETANNENGEAPVVEVPEVEVPEVEEPKEITMTLEEIIDQMYLDSELEMPGMMKSEINAENMVYMVGTDNFEFVQSVVSEPMMSSQAHSVVLFTVNEGADIETIKSDIKSNVDGRKWICVGVEPENILVENVGNHIMLIMDNNSQILMDKFLAIMN